MPDNAVNSPTKKLVDSQNNVSNVQNQCDLTFVRLNRLHMEIIQI